MPSPTTTSDRPLLRPWAITLLGCVAATWPLWTPLRELPRVAPSEWLATVPPRTDFALLAIVVVMTVASLLASDDRTLRTRVALATTALAVLAALDQLRWQPWAYHALLVGSLLFACEPRRANSWARLLAISVYAWSALAKLDLEFADTIGTRMAATLVSPFGWNVMAWSGGARRAAALALPAGELLIAALLAASWSSPRIARFGSVLAVVMHGATIAVLGPWGLGHSLGVLVWNAGFAWQTWTLFWPTTEDSATEHAPRATLAERLVIAIAVLAIAAPAALYARAWDAWPSWGLYAPRAERATILVHESVLDRLPAALRSLSRDAKDPGPWRRVRIDLWGLDETRAPLYPQNRVKLALAAWLAERYPIGDRVRVAVEGPTGRWARDREATIVDGAKACREAANGGWGVGAVVAGDR
ncbi:MAG: hypothetical protein ACRCT8_00935 [Lacipirellulaceae bacterium]